MASVASASGVTVIDAHLTGFIKPQEGPAWDGSCSSITPGIFGVMRLYADGRLVATRQLVRSGEQWRLPSGFKAQFWQIEFEARAKIYSVEMATSAKELANV